jgi:hypothetical protein
VPMSTLLPVDVRFAARTLVLDPPLTDAELEVAYDCFLLAPPDDVDCLESILLRQLKHELSDAGCGRRLQEPVALLEVVS